MHIFAFCYARFSWKLSVKVVFIFSSKTSILVWCGLKQAENEPKTTHVSDPRLSLCENDRFKKRAYSACFQAENDLYINSGTVPVCRNPVLGMKTLVFAKTCAKRSFSIQSVPRDAGFSLFWMRSDWWVVFKYWNCVEDEISLFSCPKSGHIRW
jgi:hypothetical protein